MVALQLCKEGCHVKRKFKYGCPYTSLSPTPTVALGIWRKPTLLVKNKKICLMWLQSLEKREDSVASRRSCLFSLHSGFSCSNCRAGANASRQQRSRAQERRPRFSFLPHGGLSWTSQEPHFSQQPGEHSVHKCCFQHGRAGLFPPSSHTEDRHGPHRNPTSPHKSLESIL